jgi:hypothetical protein
LHIFLCIMQIPYDLEFVENRPRVDVRAHAVAIPDSYGTWRGSQARSEEDAFDALLHWVHRVISRLESKPH